MWKLFSFQGLGSSFFHSITVEGKNEFLKKLCFILNNRTLSTFQVLKAKFCCETTLGRELADYFLIHVEKT